ncbi:hypothetical protein [Stygiolobus caldivivus]|uniref:Uncharacterized protein n=1 Tax=Stygiolobus caldivivus TaxID=2824673 RepID=A0A8D5U548_9CREN|nr:hypothetical protein [Stygiolobus caldivivus]BCU69641.1 hypothetical protein KN1_09380 [Stygiolobus caldivivus]
MIVISDHMDPDVDFYVPPGTDATEAFQEAYELSKVYGVVHIVVRGRVYIFAQQGVVPLYLSQSLHHVIEGDGLAEIVYVNPNNVPANEVKPVIAAGSDTTVEMHYASQNQASVFPQIVDYSTWGWVFAMKNLRIVNLTPQRWFMITGFPYHMHSTMFYFDTVEFFTGVWLNQTAMVVLYNCYVNNAEILFDTQSRELMAIGCRFDRNAVLAMSPRGWTVVGCVFVGTNVTVLNPGTDGNDGSVIGCIFDGTTIVTQGATRLRIVGSTFENLTVPSQGSIILTLATSYLIVGCSFNNYNVTMQYLKLGNSITVAFNTFNSSDLVMLVEDGQNINVINIIGNMFNNSPIFISGSSTSGKVELTGKVDVIYVSFNTFIMNDQSNWDLGNGYVINGISPINVGITVNYVYVVMNNFLGSTKSSFSLQKVNQNVGLIEGLYFYYNVNLGEITVPSGQSVVNQMNF